MPISFTIRSRSPNIFISWLSNESILTRLAAKSCGVFTAVDCAWLLLIASLHIIIVIKAIFNILLCIYGCLLFSHQIKQKAVNNLLQKIKRRAIPCGCPGA